MGYAQHLHIFDIHSQHRWIVKLFDADIFGYAGDFTINGSEQETLDDFMNWFCGFSDTTPVLRRNPWISSSAKI